MYSLWRGDVLLGPIVPELPNESPRGLIGILQPSDAFSPALAMIQQSMDTLPSSPVWQHSNPPDAIEKGRSARWESVGPRVLSETELHGVPAPQQLRLRDATGLDVPTTSISIREMRLANQAGIDALCAAAGVPFTGWCVFAGLAGPTERAL
jgi:hypothetical protein